MLGGGAPLTWPELWDVLRWYAHNRGYDANRAWSRQEKPDTEDSEKAQRAHELLREFKRRHGRPGTMAEVFCDHLLLREFERRHGRPGTLAEVVCDHLGVDPRGPVKSSRQRVRHLGAAFPREGVEAEVERILQAHKGILPGVDDPLIHALLRDHTARPVPGLRLPARYGQRQPDGTLRPGGLLFGQLLPRFDNRIIARCPIAYERVYQQVLTETGDREKARREAEKRATVPAAHDADAAATYPADLINKAAELDDPEEWDRTVIDLLTEAEIDDLSIPLPPNTEYLVMSVAGYILDMTRGLPYNCFEEWMAEGSPAMVPSYLSTVRSYAAQVSGVTSPWHGLTIMRALGVVFASGRYIAGEQPDWLEGETRRYSEEARRSRGPERSSSHEPKGLW